MKTGAMQTDKQDVLPVTLLSGFLGAGKTTLLQHILRNKENLRCAIIVNDMAALNIDAMLVSKSEILQRDEKMVEMQNGCICCTLREDLLIEISNIAASGKFDYIIIESTGISEPMQVAETFVITSDDLAEGGVQTVTSLEGIARLDTCVTVVDATSIFGYFENSKLVVEEFSSHGTDSDDAAEIPNPERTVVDLLVDQIEFSNVILLNKSDVVAPETLSKAMSLLRHLNATAEIIPTKFSQVPLNKVLNTKKFNYKDAANSPGWLKSLQEEHVPETIEYGISSFVYRARRPFHPQRIFDLVFKYFMIMENVDDDHEHDEEKCEEDEQEPSVDDACEMDQAVDTEATIKERLNAKKSSVFANLYRSKGFFWLATRPYDIGEWAQAGTILTVNPSGNWMVCTDEDDWPIPSDQDDIAAVKEVIRRDFATPDMHNGDAEVAAFVGDRRQEIVFIGDFASSVFTENGEFGGSEASITREMTRLLDACLVSDDEWVSILQGMKEMEEARKEKLSERTQRDGDVCAIRKRRKTSMGSSNDTDEVTEENAGTDDEIDEDQIVLELPEILQKLEDPFEPWN